MESVLLIGLPALLAACTVFVFLRKLKTGADILMKKGRISSGYYH